VPYGDSGLELESIVDPASLIHSVEIIPDSFLAPYLAFEALYPGPWESGVLYKRIDVKLIPVASINKDEVPEISDIENLSNTDKESRIINVPAFEKQMQLVPMGAEYYVLLPKEPMVPESLSEILTKAVCQSHAIALTSYPLLDMWDDSKIDKLLEFNRGMVYSSVCLFIIDASGIIEWAHSISPHALNGSIMQHTGRFLTKVMGNSGFSYTLTDTSYLCAYFCRTQSDPELLAIQTFNAMKRGLGLPATITHIPRPLLAVSTTGHDTKSRIKSFIDAR